MLLLLLMIMMLMTMMMMNNDGGGGGAADGADDDGDDDDDDEDDALLCLQVEINTDYIPRGLEAVYTREKAGHPLESLVPHGKNPEQFMDGLATKFKSVSDVLVFLGCVCVFMWCGCGCV